ncbi:MAG: 2-oxoglutarate dehydrogenase E1 component, partial [Spirochaetia bacterium]|nr:2-oxoglutarate dehydrogenase E1 component [Spirochaetia bacterium]
LLEGHPVRLSGQDSQRGTFSHRHAVIRDFETEKTYVPLQEIDAGQAPISIHNSILSEYCILGFEFGYSLASPKSLTIWEAQFGDFSNGAQIIIDQFLSASETKWQRMSGLVLLLPHGYEGQGPEHSSARPERYLQLCAEHNMYVVNISTPANFFHAVRRQIKNPFRKPLVVFTPKSLLRHPRVVSPVEELVQGSFREVIDDEAADVKKTKRVIFCTGKIYYDLVARREKLEKSDTALVRVEQLYPLPRKKLEEIRKKYASAKEFVWLQEEPANMGAWSHMLRHLNDFDLHLISRPEASSPATAFTSIHETWQEKIVSSAFS